LDQASITRDIETAFTGVDVVVASAENGAPEIAWGDTFFIYDPNRDLEEMRRCLAPRTTTTSRRWTF
jgi:hypothetical protein